jgi:hypothetical protein
LLSLLFPLLERFGVGIRFKRRFLDRFKQASQQAQGKRNTPVYYTPTASDILIQTPNLVPVLSKFMLPPPRSPSSVQAIRAQ